MARKSEFKRVTTAVDLKTFERLQFWAESKGISVNQFVNDAINLAIDFENRHYPMTTIEEARLGQIIESVDSLSVDVKNLSDIIISTTESVMSMARGDDYMFEYENGDGV